MPLTDQNEYLAKAGPVLSALAFAFTGALVAALIGIPAPALIGSTLAVTLAAYTGLKPRLPEPLRNIGYALIGGTLGAGVTPHFFSDVAHYPESLFALTVSIAVTILASSFVLVRGGAVSRSTSILATSPGALSYTLALSVSGQGDVRAIMVLQSIRLLLITLVLPPFLSLADLAERPGVLAVPVLPFGVSILILLFSAAAGLGLGRLRVPAAWLLGGLAVSGVAHGLGIVAGRFNEPVTFAGFAIAGAVIGGRFSGITTLELHRFGVAGLVSTVIAVFISALIGLATAHFTDLPFAQVWVAFAPGGVEAMSAIAITLGHDPVFVATHHIFRILLLIGCLPLLLSCKKAD